MNQIKTILLSLCLMSILTSCGGGEDISAEAEVTGDAAGVNEGHAVSKTEKLFDKEMSKQACDILTPNDVAMLFDVDPSKLTQRSIVGMCLYEWEGGQANLAHIHISKDAKSARTRFENSYRNQSGEEVADNLAKIDAGIGKQNAEGEMNVDPKQAKVVTGAMSKVFSGGFQFEEVPGLGDEARFEVTRTETVFGGKTFVSYANTLNVLISNLKFSVSFSRDGEPMLYPDENIALAKVVLSKLQD